MHGQRQRRLYPTRITHFRISLFKGDIPFPVSFGGGLFSLFSLAFFFKNLFLSLAYAARSPAGTLLRAYLRNLSLINFATELYYTFSAPFGIKLRSFRAWLARYLTVFLTRPQRARFLIALVYRSAETAHAESGPRRTARIERLRLGKPDVFATSALSPSRQRHLARINRSKNR